MARLDKVLAGLVVSTFIALIGVVGGTLVEQPVIRVGDRAPSFSIVTDQGKTISPSEFGGKLLVLNFWATWCGGCVQEIGSLDAFQREFAREGVVVLGVSMDANENLYGRFLRRFHISFATARDPSWELSSKFGTFQLPETYIIEPSGKVVEKLIAAHDFMDPEFLSRAKRQLNRNSN